MCFISLFSIVVIIIVDDQKESELVIEEPQNVVSPVVEPAVEDVVPPESPDVSCLLLQ